MSLYLGSIKGQDVDTRVQEIMKQMGIDDNEDMGDADDAEFDKGNGGQAESNAIEDIVSKRKDQISDEYRLFESVIKKNSKQVIRYVW
jgi:hypothetical protein